MNFLLSCTDRKGKFFQYFLKHSNHFDDFRQSFQTSNIKYAALSATSLGENVLSTNHSDPVRQTSTHGASEQVAAKANTAEGKILTFHSFARLCL